MEKIPILKMGHFLLITIQVDMHDRLVMALQEDLTTRVLGAEIVVVGMRPAVAITIVELGLSLETVRTALSVDKGMALLTSLLKTPVEADSHEHPPE